MEEVDVFGGRIGVIIGDKWNEIQVVCDLENCGTVRQKIVIEDCGLVSNVIM